MAVEAMRTVPRHLFVPPDQQHWAYFERLRKEDPVLPTGEAVFTNDMKVPGALYMAVLRSPYAHARIVSIDFRAPSKSPSSICTDRIAPW